MKALFWSVPSVTRTGTAVPIINVYSIFGSVANMEAIVHNSSFCSVIGMVEILSEKLSSVGEILERALKGDENQAALRRKTTTRLALNVV